MRSPNWSAIKYDYCTGYMDDKGAHHYWTLDQLAERYGLSHSALLHRSADENWTAAREAVQHRMYKEAIIKYEGAMQEKLCRADQLAVDYGLAVMQAIIDVVTKEPETERERVNLAIRYTKTFGDAYALVHTGIGIEQLKEQFDLEDREDKAA
jgi:hypothetical protein